MKLKKVERENPMNRAEKKWYLAREPATVIGIDEISEDIQGRSAMTKGDILSVLSNLVQVLPKYLKSGNSVRLDGLGTLRVTISSHAADTKEALTARQVKEVRLRFFPANGLKAAMDGISFSVS